MRDAIGQYQLYIINIELQLAKWQGANDKKYNILIDKMFYIWYNIVIKN